MKPAAVAATTAAKRSHHAPPKLPAPDEKTQKISAFFSKPPPPPQPGRPAGVPLKKRGRPAVSVSDSTKTADSTPLPAPTAQDTPASPSSSGSSSASKPMGKREAAVLVGVKLTRTNWGAGNNLERLSKAVADWDAKTGPHLQEEPKMPLTRFAVLVGIPISRYLTIRIHAPCTWLVCRFFSILALICPYPYLPYGNF